MEKSLWLLGGQRPVVRSDSQTMKTTSSMPGAEPLELMRQELLSMHLLLFLCPMRIGQYQLHCPCLFPIEGH